MVPVTLQAMCGCLEQLLYNHLFIINLIDILYLLHECRCIVNEVERVIKVSRIQLKWH